MFVAHPRVPVDRAGLLAALIALSALGGCSPSTPQASSPPGSDSVDRSPGPSAPAPSPGSLVIVGRIVTMGEPATAEAVLIEDGVVTAVGDRDEVLGRADDAIPVVDLSGSVAYPGFVDAHAHWIGDRDRYDVATPAEAFEAVVRRGWTSISEQWVNPERLVELERLAADRALPIRVEAYLALNYATEFLGDWYTSREPGAVHDHLRARGLKIHLDDGWGDEINWAPTDLTATIGRANTAGWQISIHAMSTEAVDLALDAFQAAIGPSGPNPLHHRIEHAIQVTDAQLARMVAMDIAIVTQPDGVADWLSSRTVPRVDRTRPGARDALARWRDMVDAGLHLAASTDAPWTFPESGLGVGVGRPVDLIAAAMDGRRRVSPESPAWLRDQPLTAGQGLRAVTLDAAWALGDETRRGQLAPGTLGDVTILSGDIATASPDELRAIRVVATIVGGVPVFCAEPGICTASGR
jgi:predicted amidohydrolase YtcJ